MRGADGAALATTGLTATLRGVMTVASAESASFRDRPRGFLSGAMSAAGAGVATTTFVAATFAAAAFATGAFVTDAFVTDAFVTDAFTTSGLVAVFAVVVLVPALLAAAPFAAVALVAAVLAAGFRAVTTAAGESLLSLYGFGSSPCADVRGERGPRPGEGRRGSVMSSMCYVVYWARHGAKSPARKGARSAWHPFGTFGTDTRRAIWNDAGASDCHDGKILVGLRPGLLWYGTQTRRRHVKRTIVDRRTNRDGTDTLRLEEALRRAGNRPHRPRMHTFGGGTRVDSQGFQLSNA
jgi:hypothetical protein